MAVGVGGTQDGICTDDDIGVGIGVEVGVRVGVGIDKGDGVGTGDGVGVGRRGSWSRHRLEQMIWWEKRKVFCFW